MPVLIYSSIAGLLGIIAGAIYEKESSKKVVEVVETVATSSQPDKVNCWDKLIMAGAGILAYWIYRSSK